MNDKKVYNKKNTKRTKRVLNKTSKKFKNKNNKKKYNIKKKLRKTNKKIKGGSALAASAALSAGKSIYSSTKRAGTDVIDAAKGVLMCIHRKINIA